MKYLCLLFSILVLLLSVQPCCADQECKPLNAQQTTLNNQHTEKEQTCPGCSPFFSCGSCSGFIPAKGISFTLVFYAHRQPYRYAPYQQPYPHEVAFAIWQPPRLV